MNNPVPTRHERRRQQTRQRLIQAAVDLLLKNGYDGLNVQMITDQADLGRGTFYIHFKDKEDIVWATIKDLILELEQQAHNEFEGNAPANAAYYGLLNIFRHGEQNRDLYRVILGGKGSAILMGKLQDLIVQMFLFDIRKERSAPGSVWVIPEEILAQVLTGIITRVLLWWLETPNDYSAEQMATLTYQAIYHKAPFDAPQPASTDHL
jgi:AcrR family transcriptional regulator